MAIGLKHKHAAVGNNPNAQVSGNFWNEDHVLSGTANTLLGFDSSGNAAELDASTGRGLLGLGGAALGTAVMAVGLFTAAVAGTIPSIPTDIHVVETSGYSIHGLGDARYVEDAAVDAAYVAAHPKTSFLYSSPPAVARGFRLADQIRNPYHYGALGGYASQSTALTGIADTVALQTLFNDARDYGPFMPDLLGRFWTVDASLTIDLPGGSVMRAGAVCAKSGTTGTNLVWLHMPNSEIAGQLAVYGNGSTAYNGRGWLNGLAIVDSNSLRAPAGIYGQNFKRWGAYFSTLMVDGVTAGGNNIGVALGDCKFQNVGAAAFNGAGRNVPYTFDSVTLTGGVNNANQVSTVHFTTALDPNIQVNDAFAFDRADGERMAFFVKAVDFVANTIDFYYWFPNGVTAGTIEGMWGGGLMIEGVNTAYTTVGRIYGLGIGTTYCNRGLYGAVVKFISSEAAGCNKIIGQDPNNASIGHTIISWHAESTHLDYVECGLSGTDRVEIGAPSAMNTQVLGADYLGQCFKTAPRSSAANDTRTLARLVAKMWAGNELLLNEAGPGRDGALSAPTITISNLPSQRSYKGVISTTGAGQTATINLLWYDRLQRAKNGKNWAEAFLTGTGTRYEVTGTITVQLDPTMVTAGWTFNGGATSFTIPATNGPVHIRFEADSAYQSKVIWYSVNSTPQAGTLGTTVNGDVAATLAGTSTKTQIWNTPLTANRSVTLGTANARDGDEFVIIRTAAATGNFNLNIGTGPLIALAPNQWCRVAYSSTLGAWAVVEFMGGTIAPTAVNATGAILSSGATAGVGYSTGAGGAVAQATSKSTAVTKNTMCGQVTMNAAALAAGAAVVFQVNDTNVAATDTIILNLASGNATAGTYNYQVDAVAAGSFKVWVKNISAGSLSEPLVFNYTVIKAVNA